MASSFIDDFFDVMSPEERRSWLRNATNELRKALRRRTNLPFQAEDAINEVFNVLLTNPSVGEYARENHEVDHNRYFERCLKVYVREATRRLAAEKRTFLRTTYKPLDSLVGTPSEPTEASTPELLLVEKDNFRDAYKKVMEVAATSPKAVQEYATCLADPDQDTEELANRLRTTPQNVRQRRARLQRILRDKLSVAVLLWLSGTSFFPDTFEVTIYAAPFLIQHFG
jgi:hypothetical protein